MALRLVRREFLISISNIWTLEFCWKKPNCSSSAWSIPQPSTKAWQNHFGRQGELPKHLFPALEDTSRRFWRALSHVSRLRTMLWRETPWLRFWMEKAQQSKKNSLAMLGTTYIHNSVGRWHSYWKWKCCVSMQTHSLSSGWVRFGLRFRALASCFNDRLPHISAWILASSVKSEWSY